MANTSHHHNTMPLLLAQPLVLPCGAIVKNRVIKSCMSDSLGDGRGVPTAAQVRLYERWAQGGVGLSCIGEVQLSGKYPEKPGNLVLCEDMSADDLQKFRELAKREARKTVPTSGRSSVMQEP